MNSCYFVDSFAPAQSPLPLRLCRLSRRFPACGIHPSGCPSMSRLGSPFHSRKMITLMSTTRSFWKGCVAIVAFIAFLQPVYAEPLSHKKARAVYAPRPRIPGIALTSHLRGDGYFQLRVRSDGIVSSVDVLRSTGHKVLDDATVAALSKWRFEPGTKSEVRIPFTYLF